MEKRRKDMRIPVVILKQVEKYQKENGLPTVTAAFLELVRRGLETEKREEREAS